MHRLHVYSKPSKGDEGGMSPREAVRRGESEHITTSAVRSKLGNKMIAQITSTTPHDTGDLGTPTHGATPSSSDKLGIFKFPTHPKVGTHSMRRISGLRVSTISQGLEGPESTRFTGFPLYAGIPTFSHKTLVPHQNRPQTGGCPNV
jgi:hypothetical protein